MKFRNKVIGLVSIVALLVGVSIGYTQNTLTEVYDMVFRTQNPQIRVVGTARVADRIGTTTGKLAHSRPTLIGTATTATLGGEMCDGVVVGNATSGTQTYTLPAVATFTGCTITFIAGHASSEILINMAAAGTCVITTFAAVGADADTAISTDTTCDTGLKNTAATNAIGDSLTLFSDGTRWLGVGVSSGIWAQQ